MIKRIILLTATLAVIAAIVFTATYGRIYPRQCFPILVESFHCRLK